MLRVLPDPTNDDDDDDHQTDQDPSASEPKRPPPKTRANSGRVAGNVRYVIANTPQRGYDYKHCTWCGQIIAPGSLYVNQDRWLYHKGRWYRKGPRHDKCFDLETNH